MPYFFIVPGFLLYACTMGLAIVFATVHRPSAWLRPYFISVLLWSSAGFILSTVLFAAVFLAMLGVARALISGPSTVGGIAMGLVVFAGPFVAAVLGVGGGALFGIRRTLRRSGLSLQIPPGVFPQDL